MTKQKVIQIALSAIKTNQKQINELIQYDIEFPDTSKEQHGARMYKVIISILQIQNKTFEEIIFQLKPKSKNDSKKKKKPL